MAKQTTAGKKRNAQLLKTYQNYQAKLDQDRDQVAEIIAEAVKNGGITEDTMDSLASVFRGYEYIKPIVDKAWETYDDHCSTFGYDIQH
jgi:iron uptake system EfeUOB component EfeO/EfeM